MKKTLCFVMFTSCTISGIMIAKCSAEQQTAKRQIQASLAVVTIPQPTLDRLDIKREAILKPDAMVNIPLSSLVAVLADKNAVTSLVTQPFSIIEGQDVNTIVPFISTVAEEEKEKWQGIKIDATAQITGQEEILLGISLEMIRNMSEKQHKGIQQINSSKTNVLLVSGKPMILVGQILPQACKITIIRADIIKEQESTKASK